MTMTTRTGRARQTAASAPQLALACTMMLAAVGCSVTEPAPTPPATELFQLCQQCHGEQALGNQHVNAPSIAGLPQWYIEGQLKKFKAGGRGTHFDDLTGMQMRPMAMSLQSDDEIKVIAAHVASLTPQKPKPALSGGDANKGRILFATCVACHQADASGNQALNAPPLNHASDWYLAASLKKFKAGVRGTNPLDTTGALMRPMAQTLTNDQAVADVVAYIVTLQK